MTAFSLTPKHRHHHRHHRHFPRPRHPPARLPSSLPAASPATLSYQRNKSFSHDSSTSTVTPSPVSSALPTPPPSSSSTSSTSTSSSSSSSSARLNWTQLSRQAREIVASLPHPSSNIKLYESAFLGRLKTHHDNPFLWHSLLTTLLKHHDKTYPLLKTLLSESFTKVPQGYRGILYYFQLLHFPKLSSSSSNNYTSSCIPTLLAIIATDPYPLLYNLLAAAYVKQNDFVNARATFQTGVKIFPRNPQLWNSWTFFEFKHGSKEIALHACRETLDRDVTNAKAWRTLLKLQTANGAGDVHLVDVLMEALAACPTDPVLRLQLARIEERRKGGKAALRVLENIMHSNHPDVMRMIGRILFDQGDWSNGRMYLRKAADIDTKYISLNGSNKNVQDTNNNNNNNNSNSSNSGSKIHSRSSSGADGVTNNMSTNSDAELGELDDDLSIGSSLLSKQNNKNNNNKSTLLPKNNNNVGRKDKYSRVQKAVKALHAWSIMESKVGNIDEARSLLSEARALSQTDSGIWRAIAELESREKNYDEARRAFQNAVDIDPHDARILVAWGRTEALAGNMEKCEQLFNIVDKLPPNKKKYVAHLLPSANDKSKGNRNSREQHGEDVESARKRNLSKLFDVQSSTNSTLDVVYDDEDEEDDGDGQGQGSFGSRNHGSGRRVDEVSERNQNGLTPHVLAAALRERAIMASREGRITDCVQLLTRACNMDPENETTWRLLASNELRRTGSIDSMRSIYEQGLSQVPSHLKYKLLHWWGQDERMNGNMKQARQLLTKCTMANPDYMSAWMSLGLLEKSCGNVDEACNVFEQATNRAARDAIRAPYIFQAWGNVELNERKRIDTAAQIFERGVNLTPSAAGLWTDWGLLEYERGNFNKSRQVLKKSIQVNERFIDSWIILAKLECDRCNFKSSLHYFETAMNGGVTPQHQHQHQQSNYTNYNVPSARTKDSMGTEYASVLVARAKMEGDVLGNVAVARDLYERALDIDCKLADALTAWGVMEMRNGNVKQARDLFERCSLLHGEEAEGWYLLGVLAWQHERDDKQATKMWHKVLERDASHAATYEEWAKLEAHQGNIEQARIRYRTGTQAVENSSNRKGYMGLLISWGWMELKAGNTEQANDVAKSALSLDDRNYQPWLLLAAVQEQGQGQTSAVLQILNQGMVKCKGTDCGELFVRTGETIAKDGGDMAEARKVWKAGVQQRPANARIWKDVIQLETKYGDAHSAQQVSKVYQEIFRRRSADCEQQVLRFVATD